ncbi:MBL fold metallo-hydrolase [Sandarakinorhabdus limnophila]|uniref:MBL fold metallo-hydrolase n=1 Tax=Sandarakinorhabdus limnophila TaxID=210512 RepID=UPI000426E534|nr:MBL fold metallo-hydrolase [Sandarakinorhabdus limnophila]
MRRLLLLLLILAAVGGLWLQRAPLGEFVFSQIAERRAGRNALAAYSDGLTLVFCGTGSPVPDPQRAEACLMVKAGDNLLLIDGGDGGARKLGGFGVPLGGLDAVLLTHLHSDHIEGLVPALLLRWTGSAATTPLPLIGPPGTSDVAAGYNLMMKADAGYRTSHHGPAIVPPGGGQFAGQDRPAGVVWNSGGLVITAFEVNHAPVAPAYGYRIQYKGRTVVVSGDTAATPAMAQAARGADVLVHEALQPRLVAALTRGLAAANQPRTAQITRDILTYHTTPEQAATAAAQAGVQMLMLTHIVPQLPSRFFEAAFLGDAPQRFAGPIRIAHDGTVLHLPAGSRAIEEHDL